MSVARLELESGFFPVLVSLSAKTNLHISFLNDLYSFREALW